MTTIDTLKFLWVHNIMHDNDKTSSLLAPQKKSTLGQHVKRRMRIQSQTTSPATSDKSKTVSSVWHMQAVLRSVLLHMSAAALASTASARSNDMAGSIMRIDNKTTIPVILFVAMEQDCWEDRSVRMTIQNT